MAIQRTTWRPDTCDCQIIYEWDDSLPIDQRVHKPITSVTDSLGKLVSSQVCSHHALVKDHIEHHDVVLAENQMKNEIVGEIMKADSALKHDDVEWTFVKDQNNERILEIEVPSKPQVLSDVSVLAKISQDFSGKISLK